MANCTTCEGTGIGYGKVPGGWMETDCSDCDGAGTTDDPDPTIPHA